MAASVETPVTQLETIDGELRCLLPALNRCANGRVFALCAVRRVRFLALLPFHLHVWWPDELKWLPLTSRLSILPVLEDQDVTVSPLYSSKLARLRIPANVITEIAAS